MSKIREGWEWLMWRSPWSHGAVVAALVWVAMSRFTWALTSEPETLRAGASLAWVLSLMAGCVATSKMFAWQDREEAKTDRFARKLRTWDGLAKEENAREYQRERQRAFVPGSALEKKPDYPGYAMGTTAFGPALYRNGKLVAEWSEEPSFEEITAEVWNDRDRREKEMARGSVKEADDD